MAIAARGFYLSTPRPSTGRRQRFRNGPQQKCALPARKIAVIAQSAQYFREDNTYGRHGAAAVTDKCMRTAISAVWLHAIAIISLLCKSTIIVKYLLLKHYMADTERISRICTLDGESRDEVAKKALGRHTKSNRNFSASFPRVEISTFGVRLWAEFEGGAITLRKSARCDMPLLRAISTR